MFVKDTVPTPDRAQWTIQRLKLEGILRHHEISVFFQDGTLYLGTPNGPVPIHISIPSAGQCHLLVRMQMGCGTPQDNDLDAYLEDASEPDADIIVAQDEEGEINLTWSHLFPQGLNSEQVAEGLRCMGSVFDDVRQELRERFFIQPPTIIQDMVSTDSDENPEDPS